MIEAFIKTDWKDLLKEEFSKKYFSDLERFVLREYREQTIFPKLDLVFDALNVCPYEKTRVVIIGQDPYINDNQAHGMAFSVQPGADIPPSLMNIFRELEEDCKCYIPNNGYLYHWAEQGVLLLNTILTVRKGRSLSHANVGWETFTDQIIKTLNNSDNSIVYMLWGNKAKSKADLIDNSKHMILKAVHPSPLAGGKFLGCGHFSKANEYLYETTPSTIDWQIPNIEIK